MILSKSCIIYFYVAEPFESLQGHSIIKQRVSKRFRELTILRST